MKLDKYISLSGYTSRRKAYDLIGEKRITVNGKPATHSTKVSEGDEILIDGKKLISRKFVPVFIAYNKPRGIICTTEKIYPVGRLDRNSEGLILLTNRGELIDKIANAANEHEKEYIVTLNLPVRTKFLNDIQDGVVLDGVKTRPCRAWREPGTKRIFRIVLTQGMNRQIRRMCTMFDYQVIRLQRVRVMNIELGKLASGEWRNLTQDELEELISQLP